MTRGRLIIAAAAATCLLVGLVFCPSSAQTRQSDVTQPPAQMAPSPGDGPPPGHFGPPGGMSAELQETLQIYMVHKLTEELGLSDEQALKIMPLIKEREENRWDHFRCSGELQRELAAMLEDNESSDAGIENALTAIRQSERELHQREDQLNLEIAALLTTRQYAQFVLFQQRFHNEIRQRVRRLRGMDHHGGRRNDRPN